VATYILVHGAWHGAWCWRKLVPLLEREGHTAIAPDLPGHGQDRTPIAEVSFRAYTDRICEIIDSRTEPVILVGHSMAGAIISQAAEYRAERVKALVYLCAYLLRDGESLTQAAKRDSGSKAPPNLVFSADRTAMTFREDAIHDILYTGCSAEDAAWAKSQLVPQATRLWAAPLQLTEARFGQVPRVYIECLRDQAISLSLQRQMCAALPCREVLSLDTGHSPFLSAPEELAGLLVRVQSDKLFR
jgi:pimeloyl-ACP methyl ester carboxylesterase